MYELELREKVREINDLWIPDYVSKEERNRLLQGYKLKKTYLFGKYREIELNVWCKDKSKLYEVVNTTTGATKCITGNWNEAYGMAKQLSARYRMFCKLWGE